MRLKSPDESARKMAERAHQFREFNQCNNDTIVIPSTSSERRRYIPIGLANDKMVVTNSVYFINNSNLVLWGIIASRMQVIWLNSIGGKLKTDYRYTSLVYNSFPFPKISEAKKAEIEQAAEEVLITRENYPGSTLADLYDPDKMPQDLREAHARLDDIVDSCYPGYPFANDDARLECLFKLYEKMTAKKN